MSLPIPLPGETTHSYITRIVLRSGAHSASAVLRRMKLSARDAVVSPLGNGVKNIYDAHPELADVIPPEAMVWGHTLAPLFVVLSPLTASPDTRSRFVEGVLASGGWGASNRVCASLKPAGLRECPDCQKEDTQQFGVPYWHRAHQVGPVGHCWRHGGPLREHCWSPGVGFQFELPGHGRYSLKAPKVALPRLRDEALAVWIAESFAQILDHSQAVDPGRIHVQLVSKATERGLMSRSRPSWQRVWDKMLDTYGAAFLEHLNLPTVFSAHVASRYVRPLQGKSTDPVITVLLAGALGVDFTWLPTENRSLDTNDTPLAEEMAVDHELEECLRNSGYILNRAQVALGISRHQLVQRILRAGITCPIVFGANAKFDAATVLLMIKELRAGAARSEIEQKYGCNSSFIDQLAIYDAELRAVMKRGRHDDALRANREAVVQYIQRVHDLSRTALRHALPGPMSFLDRHDREWLAQQLARIPFQTKERPGPSAGRARVADAVIDEQLRARISEIVPAMDALEPPRRRTPTLAIRLAGIRLSIFVKLSAGRLPLTHALLSELTESEASFVERKLQYAICRLAKERNCLTAVAIRKASGLSESRLRAYRDLVHKVAASHQMSFSSHAAPWLVAP